MSISLPAVPDSRSTQAGHQGGSLLHFILLHAEIQKGQQECQLSVAGRELGVWDWMRRQRVCLRGLGLAGGWTTQPTTALGNPWHGTCRGPMTIDLCIEKVRVQSLPLPQGTRGSCPISQEGSLANEQYTVLGEDPLCPSCPSSATKQKRIHETRGRIQVCWGMLREYGRNTMELE